MEIYIVFVSYVDYDYEDKYVVIANSPENACRRVLQDAYLSTNISEIQAYKTNLDVIFAGTLKG